MVDTVHIKTLTTEDLYSKTLDIVGTEAVLISDSDSTLEGQRLISAMIDTIIDSTYKLSLDDIDDNVWTSEREIRIDDDANKTLLDAIFTRSGWFISMYPGGTDTSILPQLALRLKITL